MCVNRASPWAPVVASNAGLSSGRAVETEAGPRVLLQQTSTGWRASSAAGRTLPSAATWLDERDQGGFFSAMFFLAPTRSTSWPRFEDPSRPFPPPFYVLSLPPLRTYFACLGLMVSCFEGRSHPPAGRGGRGRRHGVVQRQSPHGVRRTRRRLADCDGRATSAPR